MKFIAAILVMNNNKKYAYAMLLMALVYLLYYSITPPVWNYYGGAIATIITGAATKGEFTDTYIYGFYRFNLLFVHLHNWIPSLPWVGIVFQAITFFCYTILLKIISDKHHTEGGAKFLLLGKVLLFCMLIFPGVVRVGASANAFLLATVALLLSYFFFQSSYSNLKKAILYLLCMLLYAFAFINLLEPAMAASAMVLGYIYLFTKDKVKTFLLLAPLLVIGIFTATLIMSSMNEVPFLKKTEQALFYVGDGSATRHIPNQELSEKDKMKLQALETFFLSDEDELTEEFIFSMESLKLKSEKGLGYDVRKRLNQTYENIKAPALLNLIQLIAIGVYLIFLLLYIRQHKIKVIVFSLGFFIMVFILAYGLKLEDRHLIYLIQIFGICLLLIPIENQSSSSALKSLVFISLLLFIVLLVDAHIKSYKVQEKLKAQKIAVREFLQVTDGKIVVLDSQSISIYWGSVFHVIDLSKIEKMIYYDFGQLPILPKYKAFLDRTCNCNSRNPVLFYNWLKTNHKDIVFVSTKDRTSFLSKYMNTVHSYNLKFIEWPANYKITEIQGEGNNLYYFSVKN